MTNIRPCHLENTPKANDVLDRNQLKNELLLALKAFPLELWDQAE